MRPDQNLTGQVASLPSSCRIPWQISSARIGSLLLSPRSKFRLKLKLRRSNLSMKLRTNKKSKSTTPKNNQLLRQLPVKKPWMSKRRRSFRNRRNLSLLSSPRARAQSIQAARKVRLLKSLTRRQMIPRLLIRRNHWKLTSQCKSRTQINTNLMPNQIARANNQEDRRHPSALVSQRTRLS